MMTLLFFGQLAYIYIYIYTRVYTYIIHDFMIYTLPGKSIWQINCLKQIYPLFYLLGHLKEKSLCYETPNTFTITNAFCLSVCARIHALSVFACACASLCVPIAPKSSGKMTMEWILSYHHSFTIFLWMKLKKLCIRLLLSVTYTYACGIRNTDDYSLFRYETFITLLALVFRHEERDTQFLLCWLFLHRPQSPPTQLDWPGPESNLK